MSEQSVFLEEDSPAMLKAQQQARDSFKFFWRELSWEYKRIVPALDLSYVKVKFEQILDGDTEPSVEYMWLAEIDFDGEQVAGVLINEPSHLTYVQEGDYVTVPLTQVADWLMACQDQTYGGFTIQLLRSNMSEPERQAHDQAWGLDFGDYKHVNIVIEQEQHPDNLNEHPMSRNMVERVQEYIQEHPLALNDKDEEGYTLLMRNVIAGNFNITKALISLGADKSITNNKDKTALDYAVLLDWKPIIQLLRE
ncbi:DUF2314 domain-containing protein [Pseudomonas sp. F1_0610]|uniref:DUF2314 domain-containing protein n=1 Tax=Pseudomonas sp. F1_0610 TaxID=3114284 RepID=UPI0039C0FFBA